MSKETEEPIIDNEEVETPEAEEQASKQDKPQELNLNKELLEQVSNLQQEAKDAQERYLRTVADMENLRKRVARDKEDIRRRASASLIEDLLPALDNLELGLIEARKHEEAKNIVQGFDVVVSQLNQILKGHGLERIDPNEGDSFDHHIHEAMAQQASYDIPDHHVAKVVRVGYTLNERLLRPASVVVSSGPEE